jgi:RimJ/RimL family protein N-acetyltransferase
MMLEPVTLEGQWVRLVPLALEHVPALWEVARDDDLWRLTIARVDSEDDLRKYVESALKSHADGTALPFATTEAATGRVAGSTRFGNFDAHHRRVEIGWTWIGRPWQRSPANTEAKYLMLRHAFETLRLNRVELKTDALNQRSRSAMARLGLKEEGILRKHMVTEGGRARDTVYFSAIDDEWPAMKSRLEEMLARPFTRPSE